jgi:hypothetical protein
MVVKLVYSENLTKISVHCGRSVEKVKYQGDNRLITISLQTTKIGRFFIEVDLS